MAIGDDIKDMIRTREEFVPGLAVYHVFGHLQGEPELYIIESGVIEPTKENRQCFPTFNYSYINTFIGSYERYGCIGDVGIEANYNHNRLFRSKASAEEYLRQCREAGVHLQRDNDSCFKYKWRY